MQILTIILATILWLVGNIALIYGVFRLSQWVDQILENRKKHDKKLSK